MFALLSPYKLWIEGLAIAALLAGGVALRHWDTTNQQHIGEERKQAEWDKSDKIKADAQRDRELLLQKGKDDAVALAAKDVEIANATAAGALAAKRMSDNTTAKLLASSATASNETNRKYTAALAKVFNECTARYQELGRRADGHAADALMFDRAWPTNGEK